MKKKTPVRPRISSRSKGGFSFNALLLGLVGFILLIVMGIAVYATQKVNTDQRSQASGVQCEASSGADPACNTTFSGNSPIGHPNSICSAIGNSSVCKLRPRPCKIGAKDGFYVNGSCLVACASGLDCRAGSAPLNSHICAHVSSGSSAMQANCCQNNQKVITVSGGGLKCVNEDGNAGGTATPPADQGTLIGIADTSVATCSNIMGWAGMTKDLNQVVSIHVYANGPAGVGAGPFIIPANWPTSSVNANRVDMKLVCQAIGGSPSLCGACETNPDLIQCKHRFNVKMADLFQNSKFSNQNLKDGASHPYYLYAVNAATATQPATSKIIGLANLACPN